jgi:hypothetical protein
VDPVFACTNCLSDSLLETWSDVAYVIGGKTNSTSSYV